MLRYSNLNLRVSTFKDLDTAKEIRKHDWFPPLLPVSIQHHIPKTGGKTIRRWIEQEIPTWAITSRKDVESSRPPAEKFAIYLGHLRPDFLCRIDLYDEKSLDNCFRFTFVRNPYARAISLYFHKLTYGFNGTFREHLEAIAEAHGARSSKDKRLTVLSRPQFYWTAQYGALGSPLVFKLEESDIAFSTIKSSLNLESPPRRRVIGQEPHGRSKAIIGPSEESLIRAIYEKDFEHFDYSRELPDRFKIPSGSVF